MSAINCPVCQKFIPMYAACNKCGVKMCHGCYCKGAMAKCPSCKALHQVKAIKG